MEQSINLLIGYKFTEIAEFDGKDLKAFRPVHYFLK